MYTNSPPGYATAMNQPIYLACGLRTPFLRVDGPFAGRDAVALSVPVVSAMAGQVRGPIDFGVWGSVAPNLGYSNIAREVWVDARLDARVPTFTTVMACSTSMVAAFEAASLLGRGGGALALAGGVESMSRVQVGLGQNLSDGLRRISQARDGKGRLAALRSLKPKDVRLHIPAVKNRATGKSMGEHCEEMAQGWQISRERQDGLALQSHLRASAAAAQGFFADLITPVDGADQDAFPRADTSLEKLARLRAAFDRLKGTITAGNSSPLTDGAAGLWVATQQGLDRLPSATPHVRLVDFEMAAVDPFKDGLLMAPTYALPRLLARNHLSYQDVALWEIHEAFAAQVACNIKALNDAGFVSNTVGVTAELGTVPEERLNPNGGSVALGHPFGATGARILSQAVKELAAMPQGSRAVVSICADGGLGTVALLQN